MRHFNHIHQLEETKKKLEERKNVLEEIITKDWDLLKLSVSPSNIGYQLLDKMYKKKQQGFTSSLVTKLIFPKLQKVKQLSNRIINIMNYWINKNH